MTEPFAYSVEEEVAILDWQGVETRALNLLDLAGIASLEAAVERVVGDDGVHGAVITSSRPDLGGGVDLQFLASAEGGAEGVYRLVSRLHAVFRRIETCGKPFAAATPGTAVGGVFEMMLACHRRFAADHPKARIGLPEILIGLFPGAGGATRLVRMLGLRAAGPLLLSGRMLAPEAARAAGLVDEVVPAGELRGRAVAWARQAGAEEARKPWDSRGFRIPGGAPYTPQGFPDFMGAATIAHARSRGNYPAIEALLATIYEGALVDMDTALRIEAHWITSVLRDPRSRAMMRTNFISKRALERGARRPAAADPAAEPGPVGIVGAGMMGSGIAYVAAAAGIPVTLLDRDEESAARGLEAVRRRAEDAVKRGRMNPAAAETVVGRVATGTSYDPLAGCGLVIEAVFEDPAVKAGVLSRIVEAVPPGTVIASNTSTLPITGLAAAVPDPARFLGLHFFSPVERMRLVEIIRGRESGDRAVGVVLDLVARIGKTPIVVRDARFFYANRCIIPYSVEAIGMVAEGVSPARIEHAALAAGMPVGCLQLVDETSLDLSHQILSATRAALGDSYRPGPADEVLQRMVEVESRLGRKAGAGFYDYDGGRRQRLWPGLAGIWPVAENQPSLDRLKDRLLVIQSVEAVRALEEGVLEDVREGDVGAVLGWGFAPWSGGPFSWLDMIGAGRAVELCEELAATEGGRFAPPELLREIARDGRSFYPQQAASG